MAKDLSETLQKWLDNGFRQIGQIRIALNEGGFLLRHVDDEGAADLEVLNGSTAARELARDDARGAFRPLKTAPNLRRGWELRLTGVEELRQALDYFYPAALGLYRAHLAGELHPVDLRRTLERQTGMYAVTRQISDEEADEMVKRCCSSDGGCLRTILWQLEEGRPMASLPETKFDPSAAPGIPLLCKEVCNLVVAEARKVVKARKDA